MYQQHRQKLFDQLKMNSAAVFFAAPQQVRSADTEYFYRQNSDFWYLTHFNESQAALVLIKRPEGQQTILFNLKKDLNAETWVGKRLGQDDALTKLQVNNAFSFDEIEHKLSFWLNGLTILYHAQGVYDYADCIINKVLAQLRQDRNGQAPAIQIDWRSLVHEMRVIKSVNEIAIMRKSAQICAQAQKCAMQNCWPNIHEYQLEAEVQYQFLRNGARYPAFTTIVGGGKNGCILHYTDNQDLLCSNELVLIDAGCEYLGYASDITRTFPINGTFTPEQRAIYDIVLTAQKRAIELLIPGSTIQAAHTEVIRIMVEGLVRLDILKGDIHTLIKENAYLPFYMHGLSHWVGLDVHDVGHYGQNKDRILQAGMVLTVEPGLYLGENTSSPEKYKGIGIRIEDTLVITQTGNEVITADVPKEPSKIEALMELAKKARQCTKIKD